MPTLEFKGKPFVYSHHLSVPFRQLVIDSAKSLPAEGAKPSLDDNLIIHGDNLEALKALLPRYAGKVDVIYIDPPYNTGNEGWAYNDNVNAPQLKAWLGKVVDTEDMERHDKWLSMMWPRLRLLDELASPEAVIFVSIDDNEMHRLRLLMDDVFGAENFLCQVTVEVNPKGRGLKGSDFAKTHEYICVYQAGQRDWLLGRERDASKEKRDFPLVDEGGRYRTLELRNTHREYGKHNRPNLWYPLYGRPDGIISVEPGEGYVEMLPFWPDGYEGCWTWDKKAASKNNEFLVWRSANGRPAVYRKAYSRKNTGELIRSKLTTIWKDRRFHTEIGNAEIEELGLDFQHPKPVGLIKEVLSFFPHDDLMILDSFAGSGTSGHAALALNNLDGGNRKIILLEAEDYTDTLTAERVRRVIKGVPAAKDPALKAGLGGSFTYCDLGEPMDLERFFGGEGIPPTFEQVADYVAYTATGKTLELSEGADGFVGHAGGYRLHLIYRPDPKWMRGEDAKLDLTTAERIAKAAKADGGKPVLVFAAQKTMGQRWLTDLGLTFCQLPYSIHRILGDGTEGVSGVDEA
jgi:adenine-specific DNA-methyltransferase